MGLYKSSNAIQGEVTPQTGREYHLRTLGTVGEIAVGAAGLVAIGFLLMGGDSDKQSGVEFGPNTSPCLEPGNQMPTPYALPDQWNGSMAIPAGCLPTPQAR